MASRPVRKPTLPTAIGFTSVKILGLGNYFRSCIFADIESLVYFAGIHEIVNGFHRSLSKRFPFGIYYSVDGEFVTVVAVLDLRREPLWIRDLLEERK